MRIILLVIAIFFLSIGNVHTLDINADEEILCQNIIKSLREEPHKWFINSSDLVYVEHTEYMHEVKREAWPEYSDYATFVINYRFADDINYVEVEKPDMGFLPDKIEYKLLEEIKKFLFKSLHKELGDSVLHSPPKELEQTNENEKSSLKKL